MECVLRVIIKEIRTALTGHTANRDVEDVKMDSMKRVECVRSAIPHCAVHVCQHHPHASRVEMACS